MEDGHTFLATVVRVRLYSFYIPIEGITCVRILHGKIDVICLSSFSREAAEWFVLLT